MNAMQQIVLNFKEVRRRSIMVWKSVPPEFETWKPDQEAMSFIESVRHILEGEYLYHQVVKTKGAIPPDPETPWTGRSYVSIDKEIEFSNSYHEFFLQDILNFTESDLDDIEIVRIHLYQRRKLGDYLNRIAYHEIVHTGQLLGYLRTAKLPRPMIWD